MRSIAAGFAFLLSLLAAPALAQQSYLDRAPAASATDPQNIWVLDLSTGGRVTIWLRPDVAPKMVERIKALTRRHFYDGLTFHRVIDGFMAQGGDPKGDGTGGSELPNVASEFNYLPHVRGAVSAARADDPNSANAQFFIVFQPKLNLDKKYTVFGRVIEGMEFVDPIERGEPPANPTRILHAYVQADNPPPYQAAPVPAALMPLPAGPVVATPKPAVKPIARKATPRRK